MKNESGVVFKILKNSFFGFMCTIKNKWLILTFIVCVLFSFVTSTKWQIIFSLNPNRIVMFLLMFFLILSPIIFLNIVNFVCSIIKNKWIRKFETIQFKSKNNQYPILVKSKKEGVKHCLIFNSDISLKNWRESIEHLETALNVSITDIKQGKDKKFIELKCLKGNVTLVDYIEWKNEFLREDDIFVIGEDIERNKIEIDINKTHSILISGESGSGKSVLARLLLY